MKVCIMKFAISIALAALFSIMASAAFGVECDGTEVLCLDLASRGEVEGSGGTVVGGDFNADGFMPANRGGIDWTFGPEYDFSAGVFEVDVKGLVPMAGGELEGGKVSIFAFCGEEPDDNETVGIQKMDEEYRDGHIFRYGMDDDGLADNWDAVIITGEGFRCYYSIADPLWTAEETHHIHAEWDSTGLVLEIDDGFRCEKPGNGDTFDPATALFTLANRCTHYANQHAVARFSNFKLWGNPDAPVCGNGICEPERSETCITCPADCPCPDEDEPEEAAVEPAEIVEPEPEVVAEVVDGTTPDLSPDPGPEPAADTSVDELPAGDTSTDAGEEEGPPGDTNVEGGCGCTIAAQSPAPGMLIPALLLLPVFLPLRRRRPGMNR